MQFFRKGVPLRIFFTKLGKGEHTMKKLAFLLAFILLMTPVLVACGSAETDTTAVNGAAQETEYEYNMSEAGELDYGAKKFGIFGVRGSMAYVMAEEETGDLVNDAVFQRNIAVEEAYNLTFDMFEAEPNVGADMIKNFVLSGDTTYQLYQATQHNGLPEMILNDYFVDWTQLEAVKFDRPYWNSKGVKDINFGGKIYTIGGDINLVTYNSTNCILFNQKLFDDLGIDYPYQDVYDMTWTIDKMIEIVKQGYLDLNGDSEWSAATDRAGYSGWGYENLYAIYVGMGGKSLVNDENNLPVLAMDGERTVKLIDKMIELFDGTNAWTNFEDHSIDKKMFTDGRLLMDDSMITGISANRDSEFDIGLLPYPMLDEAQGEYFSRAANIAHLSYIPTMNTDYKSTGIILEGMAIQSYNTVRPTYYDVTLSLKEAADEETLDMVDIVLGSSSYLYEGFITPSKLNGFITSKTNTWASWYAGQRKGFEKNVEKKILPFYTK